jgi:hypothetical protein
MDLKGVLAISSLPEANFHSLLKILERRDLKTMMEAKFSADRCQPAGGESCETTSPVLEYVERELDQIAESAHYLIESMSKNMNDGSSSSVDSETPSIVSELAHLKDFEDSVHLEMEEVEEDFSASYTTIPPIISVCSRYFREDSARQDYECNDKLTEPFEKNGHPCSRLGANPSPLIMPGFPVARCECSQPPPDKSTSGVQRVIRLPMMTSCKITGSSTNNSDSEANEDFEIYQVVPTSVLVSFPSLESYCSEPPVFHAMFDPLLNIPQFLARNNVFCPKVLIKGKACSCIHLCHSGRSDEETVDTLTESFSSGFFFDSY